MRKITYILTVFVLILIGCTPKTPPQEAATSTLPFSQGELLKVADQAYFSTLEQELELSRQMRKARFEKLTPRQIDSLIRDIRNEYNHIIDNMALYQKTNFYPDVSDKETYDSEGNLEYIPERDIAEYITFYADSNNNIRRISHFSLFSHHSAFRAELTDYYLKNGKLFFVFRQNRNHDYDYDYDNWRSNTPLPTTASETRIYAMGANGDLQKDMCLKYLSKSAEGNLAEVKKLLQKAENAENNCVDNPNYISIEEFTDLYYKRSTKFRGNEITDEEFELSLHTGTIYDSFF